MANQKFLHTFKNFYFTNCYNLIPIYGRKIQKKILFYYSQLASLIIVLRFLIKKSSSKYL